jgi:hypothetical protein
MDTRSSTDVLRQIKYGLVDVFVALARCVFFWIPGGDEAAGKALMTFHPLFLVLCTGMFFLLPKGHPLRILIAVGAVLVSASQWLLGGCVVTRAEQKLTGLKDTIVDPFLNLAKVEVNRDTRIAATIACGSSITCVMLWVVACDLFFHAGPI